MIPGIGPSSARSREQKDGERRHLDNFLAASALALGAPPIESEAPDFVCQFVDGRRVGIELTGLDESSQRVGLDMIEKLKQELRVAAPDLDAIVLAHTQYAGPSLLAERGLRAEVVATMVRRARDWLAGRGPQVFEDEAADDIPVLRRLAFDRADAGAGPTLLHFHSDHFSGGRFVQRARAAMEKKERRVEACRARADAAEVWLVLHGSSNAADATDGSTVANAVYDSSFDRVFILDYFAPPHVRELRTRRPAREIPDDAAPTHGADRDQ